MMMIHDGEIMMTIDDDVVDDNKNMLRDIDKI